MVVETGTAAENAAIKVIMGNVEIRGAGATNTILITHNRATTVLRIGFNDPLEVGVTNFTLADVSLEGRPHVVATNNGSGGHGTLLENGALTTMTAGLTKDRGNLVVYSGNPPNAPSVNLLFTNCVFRNPTADGLWADPSCISNVAIRNCHFIFRDGANGTYPLPRTIDHPEISTTVSNVSANTGVGILVRTATSYPARNMVVQDCTFNGNPSMTVVNTNYQYDTGDGIFWGQYGANWFTSRCVISNYGLEAIQFNDGPAVATGNDLFTYVSAGATCALNAHPVQPTLTGSSNDYAFYFVGNTVTGGRLGYNGEVLATNLTQHCVAHVSGNKFNLYPVFPLSDNGVDWPGGAVVAELTYHAAVAGNTVTSGAGVCAGWTPPPTRWCSRTISAACRNRACSTVAPTGRRTISTCSATPSNRG